jgi:hypothetical protein
MIESNDDTYYEVTPIEEFDSRKRKTFVGHPTQCSKMNVKNDVRRMTTKYYIKYNI